MITMSEIGKILVDKYEILQQIGQGGMSKVYQVRDLRLDKYWALKQIDLRKHERHQEIFEQSIVGEMELLKKLDHPALPRITDYFKEDGFIYIVIDYIDGETLGQKVEREGAIEEELVIQWALQICEALIYLHTREPKVIYRDMKPANIMVTKEGNIRLIDFGIAREYKEEESTDTIYLGTRGYAAPEQFGGKGQTDSRTDIYSLGMTLYHLVTGCNPCHPPYEIYPIRKIRPSLSRGLEEIIKKCVQLSPDKRFQSCIELKEALLNYKQIDKKDKQRKICFLIMGIFGGIIGIGSILGLLFASLGNHLFQTYTLYFAGVFLGAIGILLIETVLFFRWNMQEVFRNRDIAVTKQKEEYSVESRFPKRKDKSKVAWSNVSSEEVFQITKEVILVHTEEVI